MKKILIISDAHSLNFFKEKLAELNHLVTATSTENALSIFLTENFDYILFVMEDEKSLNSKIFQIYETINSSLSPGQKILILDWLKSDKPNYLRLPVAPSAIIEKFEEI